MPQPTRIARLAFLRQLVPDATDSENSRRTNYDVDDLSFSELREELKLATVRLAFEPGGRHSWLTHRIKRIRARLSRGAQCVDEEATHG